MSINYYNVLEAYGTDVKTARSYVLWYPEIKHVFIWPKGVKIGGPHTRWVAINETF